MKARNKLVAGAVAGLVASVLVGYAAWDPGPKTAQCYDSGRNGIWIGHQWYTGVNVRTGAAVSAKDRDECIALFLHYNIRDVFIHAGPVRLDGGIDDMPGIFFDAMRRMSPGIRYLPWIGGNARQLPLDSPSWRQSFIRTLSVLHAAGFDGVHLDIEPLSDFQPGYIELLGEIRAAFDNDFFVSHATRRLAITGFPMPVLSGSCWSIPFYRACMELCDQTVLMGYDSCIKLSKIYRAYIRFQTGKLLDCAAAAPGHRVMIGIPSYEDVPKLSDPRIENIRNAALGVRAALESRNASDTPFDGVAVYAFWTTDVREWKQYEVYWMNRF